MNINEFNKERFNDSREAIQTANDTELFATTATGRTWHKSVNCHHLRGVRTRAMRPCTDCARIG